jgi:hypothetical protein
MHKSQISQVTAPSSLHDSQSKLPHYEAVLIMDAQRVSSSVRNQTVSSGWSRLYQAGNYYLDLTLQLGSASPVLLGRVVAVAGQNQIQGDLNVNPSPGHGSGAITVDATGFFRMELGHKTRSRVVTLELEDATVAVSDIRVQ